MRESREIVNRDVAFAFARKVGDNGERSQVCERIGGQVEHRRGGAGFRMRRDGHQHVAGVRDGTIRQHPLDVGLLDGGEVAHDHGSHGAAPHDRLPAVRDGSESGHEYAQQNREGRRLGTDRKETRDRRGSALINIRRPDLKRGRGNFEAEPDEHQTGGGSSERQRRSRGFERAADVIQVGGTR